MSRRDLWLSATAWTGIGFICLGTAAYASVQHWMAPRTLVPQGYAGFASLFLWMSVMCVAVGICLLALLAFSNLSQQSTRALKFSSSPILGQYFRWAQKLPLRPKFLGIPSFGLIAATSYFLVVAPYWLLEASRHRTTVGLTVHCLKPGAVLMKNDFGAGPVVVRVQSGRSGAMPDLYVQSKLISWSTLQSELKDNLRLRPDWVVYVEGDAELQWADIARAVDIIRGLPAEVVLLTPDSTPPVTHRKQR